MPRSTEPTLGDDLIDVYRAFTFEIYDRLAAEGFPDLPQAATSVFHDIDDRGSRIADLAVQGGQSVEAMRAIVADLESSGYVVVEGDRVRPAERGRRAFEAGRRALAAAEEHLAARLGAERFAAFRAALRELASSSPSP